MKENFDLKPKEGVEIDGNFLGLLLSRLCRLLGMKFAANVNNPIIFNMAVPFSDTDLKSLPLRVKHMVRIMTS